MIERGVLDAALRSYLPLQRWYAGSGEPAEVLIVAEEVRREEWPALVWLLVEADGARYQVLLGLMPAAPERPAFLRAHDDQVLGELDTTHGRAVVYDAVLDPELAVLILHGIAPDETVEHVRPISAEQSNSSLVFDERLILKLFRRIHPGPNPDVEVTAALARTGFPWVAPPLATDETADGDSKVHLAVLQPFLSGGVDAWALALNSLRGFFADHDTQSVPVIRADMPPPPDPAQVGGDFSSDSERLGETTAAMHQALTQAFGREPGDPARWAQDISAQLDRLDAEDLDAAGVDRSRIEDLLDRLRALDDTGPSIRVHGDLHLGQVMRTDAGWFVLDFEGEPTRPVEERRRMWSPLRDVAGMCRSFSYASRVALEEQGSVGWSGIEDAGATWEHRNRAAFLTGYRSVASDGLLPADPKAEALVLGAFELERALYELAYEQAYRPAWVEVPLAGIRRLLEATP